MNVHVEARHMHRFGGDLDPILAILAHNLFPAFLSSKLPAELVRSAPRAASRKQHEGEAVAGEDH